MKIVLPEWLNACEREQRWVDEKSFSLVPTGSVDSLAECLDQALGDDTPENAQLFSGCNFLLVGFSSEETVQLGKLIRRGLGYIHWEFEDRVSHVVCKDFVVEKKALRYVGPMKRVDSSATIYQTECYFYRFSETFSSLEVSRTEKLYLLPG